LSTRGIVAAAAVMLLPIRLTPRRRRVSGNLRPARALHAYQISMFGLMNAAAPFCARIIMFCVVNHVLRDGWNSIEAVLPFPNPY
jgi:hypothetical protein